MIEQHKQLKKDNSELLEKLNKARISYETDLNLEKEKLKKAFMEIAQLNQIYKELRNQMSQYDLKLQNKDRELKDARSRLDIKQLMDIKSQDRDISLFQKQIGRQPITTNSNDSKMLSLMRTMENHKDKLENELREIKKENEELVSKLNEYEIQNLEMKKDLGLYNDKMNKEFLNKLSRLEDENTLLMKDNDYYRQTNDKLMQELKLIEKENMDIKYVYEDLKLEVSKVKGQNTPKNNKNLSILETKSERESVTPRSEVENSKQTKAFSTSKKTHWNDYNFKLDDNTYSFRPFAGLADLSLIECRRLIGEVLFNS